MAYNYMFCGCVCMCLQPSPPAGERPFDASSK